MAKVHSFHYKDFEGRQKDFYDWGPLKAKRFMSRTEKMIDDNVSFRVVGGIDPRVHADVKRRMKGITGFRGDSDYGLCLRWLLFQSCEHLSQKVGDDFSMSVIMDDGPYAAGAVSLFHQLRRMRGKNGARHARKYGDIAVLGKESLSLQVADAIVGIEADRLTGPKYKRDNRLRGLLDGPKLEFWYNGMLEQKERRRAYGTKKHPDTYAKE